MDRAPYHKAPRLGPRAFSISLVNSFRVIFFGGLAISIHETISSSIEPLLLLSGAKY